MNTWRLNSSGSSMLMVCPEQGITARPEPGMARFIISAGSRQGSSSSPTIRSTVGAPRLFIPSGVEGRPGGLHAAHGERGPEPGMLGQPAANSAQPRGFLFWNCTRVGPTA